MDGLMRLMGVMADESLTKQICPVTPKYKLDLRCYIVKLRIQGCRYWV